MNSDQSFTTDYLWKCSVLRLRSAFTISVAHVVLIINIGKNSKEMLTHLQQDQPIQALYDMMQRFVQMVKNRCVEALNPWLLDCEGLGIVQLQSFALGLRQDYAALHVALAYSWSNGQTEGQVNRLKFIK